jgi:outer membrane protein OmpA-like peptidoglycan-associated protein
LRQWHVLSVVFVCVCLSSFALAQAPPAPGGGQGTAQPILTAVKADFVPGEKVIFFDDFSDMVGDEPPPHWKVRGGTAALQTGGTIRQLTAGKGEFTLTPNIKGPLPKNFTFETEVMYESADRGDSRTSKWVFTMKNDSKYPLELYTHARFTELTWEFKSSGELLGSGILKPDLKQPFRYALWVQNGRVRLYINGDRVMDVNQVELPELQSFEVQTNAVPDHEMPNQKVAVGYRSVRLAESSPDFGQTITSSGRFVTHGILFDTDSDRLKPESAPVIRSIARGLETNPALKLLIEGHTDSTGDAARNLDLSKRRAEAVKSVLVSQFSVDATRLTTAGLGATKPMDSNDTPSGRAQNRRVEFAKQ